MSAVMADWHPVRSPCSRPAAPESSPTGVIKPSVERNVPHIVSAHASVFGSTTTSALWRHGDAGFRSEGGMYGVVGPCNCTGV